MERLNKAIDIIRLTGMMKIVENNLLTTTKIIKRRKNKKKRIEKKWNKKYGKTITVITPSKNIFLLGNTIIGHPKTINKLKEKIIEGE